MTSVVERRSLLRAAGTVAVTGLAGCGALGGASDSTVPRLVDLTAVNYDADPHVVHVRIELDGETVYRESKRIEAAEPPRSGGAVFDGYPTGSKPYVLSAWRDDQSASAAATLDFASDDTECLGVFLAVGTPGDEGESADFTLYRTTDCGEEQ